MNIVTREWMDEELGFWGIQEEIDASVLGGYLRRENITLEKEIDYFLPDWIAAYGVSGTIDTFEQVIAQLRKSLNAQAYNHIEDNPATPKKRFVAQVQVRTVAG